jgi:hypothetical protein
MAIDEQAAPAGAVTETPAPATEVADLPRPLDAPLTGAAAAKLLAEWEPDSPELPLSNPNTPSEPEAVAAAEEPVEAAQPDSEQEEAVPADDQKAEPEPEEPEDKFVHGNARTRLSDGTVTTVGELKKKADLAREYETVKPRLEQYARQLQEQAAQLAQKEQYVAHVLPLAQQAVQTKLPQPPDPKLATEDPIEHYQQMVRYQAEMGQFQQLQYAQKAQLAQAEQARQAQQQQHLAEQAVKLRELMPELQKPERQKEFTADYGKYGTEVYGFTPEELKNVTDARIMPIIRDAIAYRKHLDKQASLKPIVQAKAKAAVPVAAPAKRTATVDAQSKAYEEGLQRLRSTGSRDMAARLLAELD